MSSRDSLSRIATDLLHREEVPFDPPSADVDERAIAAITGAIEREGAMRKWRRIGGGALAAAAAVALLVGGRALLHHGASAPSEVAARVTVTGHAVAGGVVLLHDGKEMPLDGGSAIVAGDRLVAASDGRAAVSMSTGSHVIVEGGADMTIVEQDATQIFDLRAGSVRADVAKLGANERFLVRTPDAEVEVRGTSFRVALAPSDPACGEGVITRVTVSEGVVSVRSRGVESRVPAGSSWPSCAVAATETPVVAPVPTTASPGETVAPPPIPTPALGGGAAHGSTKPAAPIPASELAEQNRLYAAATAAKRSGDTAGAIRLYDDFMKRYPSSWLEESAEVERMRLLALTDKGRAREAARAYLSRYPRGFARDEATEIASP